MTRFISGEGLSRKRPWKVRWVISTGWFGRTWRRRLGMPGKNGIGGPRLTKHEGGTSSRAASYETRGWNFFSKYGVMMRPEDGPLAREWESSRVDDALRFMVETSDGEQ